MRRLGPLRVLFPALLLALLLAQAVSVLRQYRAERTGPLPVATGSVPSFRLSAADGHAVTAAELRGSWALVCLAPTGDAAALRHLAGALDALGKQAGRVRAVFVATDAPPVPATDAARVAGKYRASILALSGDAAALAAAETAFGLHPGVRSLVPGEKAITNATGPVIAVLDPDGRERAVLPAAANPETIAARLRTLGLGS